MHWFPPQVSSMKTSRWAAQKSQTSCVQIFQIRLSPREHPGQVYWPARISSAPTLKSLRTTPSGVLISGGILKSRPLMSSEGCTTDLPEDLCVQFWVGWFQSVCFSAKNLNSDNKRCSWFLTILGRREKKNQGWWDKGEFSNSLWPGIWMSK